VDFRPPFLPACAGRWRFASKTEIPATDPIDLCGTRTPMSSDLLTSLLSITLPFVAALIWARYTISPQLKFWLHRSVAWGAPLLAILIVIIKLITSTCTHEANFGFTACTTLPVTFANTMMTGFVFALILLVAYGLVLLGVGVAIELQTRLKANR